MDAENTPAKRHNFRRVVQRSGTNFPTGKDNPSVPLLIGKPEIGEAILSFIRDGMFPSEAAWCAGTTARSMKNWMNQGKKDLEKREKANREAGLPEDSGEITVFEDFYLAVKQALADAEVGSLRTIRGGGWMAHAWYLERRYPQAYGRQDRLDLKHSGGIAAANIDIAKALDNDDTRAELAKLANTLISASFDENKSDGDGDDSDEGEVYSRESSGFLE